CSEDKPKCEYCSHTGKDCEYPDVIRLMMDTNEKRLRSIQLKRQQISDQDENDDAIPTSRMLERMTSGFVPIKNEQDFFHLTNDLILIQSTTQLGISKFELRLLKFFNSSCVNIFSYGELNPDIHRIWTTHVPKLFVQSELLRKSIYSFACICLFPLCDLADLCVKDDAESDIKFSDKYGSIIYDPKKKALKSKPLPKELANSLYVRTTDYFLDAVATKNDILTKQSQLHTDEPMYGPFMMDSVTANELAITSVIIFSFLGVHPHRLLPLISFEGEADFLSISKGVCTTIVATAPLVRNSVYGAMFDYDGNRITPPLKKTNYRLILTLKDDLEFEYSCKDFNSTTAEEYQILQDSVMLLHSCIHRAVTKKYPVPVYKWIILLEGDFHRLVYKQTYFALRMVYIHACLMALTRFHVFNEANLWVDYMNWFKRYNVKLFNGWKYETDQSLYTLIFDKQYSFGRRSYATLGEFDPDFLASIL
ncbi:hypothetical protein DFJ63DRAFT_318924, partial [Scheffersomyces coipomensis]|uniref:uncharacterized protein n=1 Tax=Scheffersomyces coipomensis TaxID=1788519 RepID=UPI00315D9C0E